MPDSPPRELADTRRRRLPLIWLAPVLAFLALATWALASPVGSSPDDDFHLASIWCAAGDRTSLCAEGSAPTTRRVAESILDAPCFARDSTESGACQDGILDDNRLVDTDRGNFAGQYPPVYYGVMSLFAGDDIQASVIAMRLVNALLLVGILTGLTLLLPFRLQRTLLWAWLITVIPLGLFLVASINPSAWAIIGVGTAWLALAGYLEATGRRRLGLGGIFLVSSVMALGSRGDAAIYLGLTILAVMFLYFRRDRAFLRSAILPAIGLVLVVVALLISRQLGVAVVGFQESGASAPPGVSPGSALGLAFSNLANAPSLWAGVFGSWSLGWFDTTMPFVVALGGVGVFVAATFTGIAVLSWRKVLVTAGALAALWIIPVYTLTRGGQMVGTELQPRYLLPLIVVLAGLALLPVADRQVSFTRAQRILIVGTSIATQALALFYTMRRFITGDDVNGFDLAARAEWWWTGAPTPMLAWVVGSLAWAALVVIVVRYLSRERAA